FFLTGMRPLRTSWLIVGISLYLILSRALARNQAVYHVNDQIDSGRKPWEVAQSSNRKGGFKRN
ncbi:MAG: hypothetical protein KDB07_11260, partial [Planctomycetes bacterium]|nr:hypothetical protein [Planctomycetota bacterium]